MTHTRKTMHRNSNPIVFKNAHTLRSKPTKAEEILWECLRKKRMDGIKFRRQHPIDNYILDFYAHELKLAIELDGGYHEEKSMQFQDQDRDSNLSNMKIFTLRFTNEQVLKTKEEVLQIIHTAIIELKTSKLTKPKP